MRYHTGVDEARPRLDSYVPKPVPAWAGNTALRTSQSVPQRPAGAPAGTLTAPLRGCSCRSSPPGAAPGWSAPRRSLPWPWPTSRAAPAGGAGSRQGNMGVAPQTRAGPGVPHRASELTRSPVASRQVGSRRRRTQGLAVEPAAMQAQLHRAQATGCCSPAPVVWPQCSVAGRAETRRRVACALTLGSRIAPGWRLYQSCRRPTFGCTTLMPFCAAAAPCTKLQAAEGEGGADGGPGQRLRREQPRDRLLGWHGVASAGGHPVLGACASCGCLDTPPLRLDTPARAGAACQHPPQQRLPTPSPVHQHQVACDALRLQLLGRHDGRPSGGHAQQYALLIHPNLAVHVDDAAPAGDELVCGSEGERQGASDSGGHADRNTWRAGALKRAVDSPTRQRGNTTAGWKRNGTAQNPC